MWTAWRRRSSRAPANPELRRQLGCARASGCCTACFDPRVFAQAFVDLYHHVQPAEVGLAMNVASRRSRLAGGRVNPQRARAPWGFPEVFVISQTALPALLYLPGTQPFRLPIRISAFAISLAALAWRLMSAKEHVRPRAVPELDDGGHGRC